MTRSCVTGLPSPLMGFSLKSDTICIAQTMGREELRMEPRAFRRALVGRRAYAPSSWPNWQPARFGHFRTISVVKRYLSKVESRLHYVRFWFVSCRFWRIAAMIIHSHFEPYQRSLSRRLISRIQVLIAACFVRARSFFLCFSQRVTMTLKFLSLFKKRSARLR